MNQAVHQVYRRLGAPGLVAVGSAAVALIVLFIMVKLLVGTLFVPSAKLVQAAENERKEKAKQYATAFEGRLAQLNGRSLWFVPSAPPPPQPKEPPPIVDTTPKTPPPPSTYGGPALIAMVNGFVWFADGKKLAAGEGDSDLKVIELRPPWGALVKWKDIQFTVGLFDRDSVVYPPPKETKTEPADALMGPEAPPESLTEDSKSAEAKVKPPPAPEPAPPRGDAESESPASPQSPPPVPPAPRPDDAA